MTGTAVIVRRWSDESMALGDGLSDIVKQAKAEKATAAWPEPVERASADKLWMPSLVMMLVMMKAMPTNLEAKQSIATPAQLIQVS